MASSELFAALRGRWHFERTFTSRHASLPSGHATGIADFEMRDGPELLQTESGRFTAADAQPIEFSRRYVFALDNGELCVYFADPQPPYARAGLFHRIEFDEARPTAAQGTQHLCVNDLYRQSFQFGWSGSKLERFEIDDVAKGPEKDWTATTEYTRAASRVDRAQAV